MMTDQQLDAAEVLRGQLADVLVDVSAITLARFDRAIKMNIFDWCQEVGEAAAKMQRCPPPPKAIRRYLRPEQLSGEWSAFTTWRPSEPKKEQRGLF